LEASSQSFKAKEKLAVGREERSKGQEDWRTKVFTDSSFFSDCVWKQFNKWRLEHIWRYFTRSKLEDSWNGQQTSWSLLIL